MSKEISILLGPPLAGKSTFALTQPQYLHTSMGYLCNQEIKSNSVEGKYFAESLKYGLAIPSFLLIPMIQKYIELSENKLILLDGFPKSEEEANCLLYMATVCGYKLSSIYILQKTEEDLLARLQKRTVCDKCYKPINFKTCACGGVSIIRPEDTPEYFEKRYARYTANSKQIVKTLQSHFKNTIYV